MAKVALIAGATGLVGSYLLEKLLESEDYERVISVVRHPSGKSHKKLREKLVSFPELHNLELKSNIDDAFCCLGTTMKKAKSRRKFMKVDLDFPIKFAELATKYGGQRMFIVSSLGANKKSPFFYNRVKGKLESELEKLSFKSLFIFRPSLILGDRKEKRLGEDVAKGLNTFLKPLKGNVFKHYKGIQAEDIAKAMLSVSKRKSEGKLIFENEDMIDITSGTA